MQEPPNLVETIDDDGSVMVVNVLSCVGLVVLPRMGVAWGSVSAAAPRICFQTAG